MSDNSSETLPLLAPAMAVLAFVFSQLEVGWLWYHATDKEKKLAFIEYLLKNKTEVQTLIYMK